MDQPLKLSTPELAAAHSLPPGGAFHRHPVTDDVTYALPDGTAFGYDYFNNRFLPLPPKESPYASPEVPVESSQPHYPKVEGGGGIESDDRPQENEGPADDGRAGRGRGDGDGRADGQEGAEGAHRPESGERPGSAQAAGPGDAERLQQAAEAARQRDLLAASQPYKVRVTLNDPAQSWVQFDCVIPWLQWLDQLQSFRGIAHDKGFIPLESIAYILHVDPATGQPLVTPDMGNNVVPFKKPVA